MRVQRTYLLIPLLLILCLAMGSVAVLGANQSTMAPATAGACPSPTLLAGTAIPATEIPTTSSATEIAYETAAAKTVAVTQKGTKSATKQAAGAKTAEATEQASSTATSGCPTMAVKMSVGSFFFKPNKVAVPANTDVTFTFTNGADIEHYFVIHTDKVDVKIELAPNTTVSKVLNLPKGTYQFYCIVPGHKQQGMIGQLIVG